MLKACALIRANLHRDPTAGCDEDFAADYAAALWLEQWRQKAAATALNQAIAAAFGEKRD